MKLSDNDKRICELIDKKQYPYLHREELIRAIELLKSAYNKED